VNHVQDLEETVISLIASGVPGKFKKTRITGETQLQKELGLDSLGILALVFRFEEMLTLDLSKMKIEINVAKLRTVSDVVKAAETILEKARTVHHA
jgi:acyl carrier protein